MAITGVALALPDADDLGALHRNLLDGRVSVRAPDKERVHYAGAPTNADYVAMGYLNRIDLFDHRFFGLSRREAELMDPHQRMAAQLAHRAHRERRLRAGGPQGLVHLRLLSAPEPQYATLYTDDDPQQILGGHPSAVAARIAYLFGFDGPNLVLDTACSGSLTALAVAVGQLQGGQADLALAADSTSIRSWYPGVTTGPWSAWSPRAGCAARSTPARTAPPAARAADSSYSSGWAMRSPTATTFTACCAARPSTTTAPAPPA